MNNFLHSLQNNLFIFFQNQNFQYTLHKNFLIYLFTKTKVCFIHLEQKIQKYFYIYLKQKSVKTIFVYLKKSFAYGCSPIDISQFLFVKQLFFSILYDIFFYTEPAFSSCFMGDFCIMWDHILAFCFSSSLERS